MSLLEQVRLRLFGIETITIRQLLRVHTNTFWCRVGLLGNYWGSYHKKILTSMSAYFLVCGAYKQTKYLWGRKEHCVVSKLTKKIHGLKQKRKKLHCQHNLKGWVEEWWPSINKTSTYMKFSICTSRLTDSLTRGGPR